MPMINIRYLKEKIKQATIETKEIIVLFSIILTESYLN